MLRYFKIAFQLLAMVFVLVLAAGITLRLALHTGEVRIPELSGLTVSEASDAALHSGLDLNIENKFYSTTIPAGRILSQAPAPGSEVRKGWQVRVTESLGPQQVTIPDVVGEPMRQASMDLRRVQLDLGTLAHFDAPGDADLVLAQTPPPNAGLDQPRVNLLLSASASDATAAFVMPSFVGMSYTNANRAAIALGLRVATIGGIPSTPAAGPSTTIGADGQSVTVPAAPVTPGGPVLTQSPEAGHRGTRNEVIRFYFYRPSVAVTSPATITITAPTTPATPPQ
ncbi:MAG: PASTA domain-containing protein [Janthinobacterium lividum]